VIQARQQPFVPGVPVTVNTAVAAEIDGDRVGVYAAEPKFLLVNGLPQEALELERVLPHGGTLVRRGSLVIVAWKDGSRLTVHRFGRTLNYVFDGAPHIGARGLLGSARDSANSLTSREGSILDLSDAGFPTKLYSEIGNSWRIKPSESLFYYWPGEDAGTFAAQTAAPAPTSASSLPAPARDSAAAICRAVGVWDEPLLDDCTLDVGITHTPSLAASFTAIEGGAGGALTPSEPAPAGPPSAASANHAPPASDQFAIGVGDSVFPDHPARGAGIITHFGQRQSYAFRGRKGQVVYIAAGLCQSAHPTFVLLAPNDSLMAMVIGNCNADIGRQKLPVAGTYHVVTALVNPADTARYRFVVLPVPPARHITVRLPVTIGPDTPTRGAGRLTSKGADQYYDFRAAPGAAVHIESQCGQQGCPHLGIQIMSADDSTNSQFWDLNYLKHDWTLPAGGRYTIHVRSAGFTGDYGFVAAFVASGRR
jgi:hypothetical protein